MGRKGQGKGGGRGGGGGGGGGGRFNETSHQTPNVTEETRIRIKKILEEFQESPAQVYTFEPDMSKYDRAAIHIMCRKMGMTSKSTGKKNNRVLSVYKTKKKEPNKKHAAHEVVNTSLKFSEETRSILQDLFTQYPPDDAELTAKTLKDSSGKSTKEWSQDSSFCRPAMSKAEISKKIEQLASKSNDPARLKKIAEDRAKLPIASFRDEITSTLESHQVVLISGETGCGKTTQVPQFILDYMWGRGDACKIVCTQPRRISAISVAERISFERGESVGDTVGYKIRLESKGGKNSSIMFCTNGVLLRLLIGRGSDMPKLEASNSSRDGILEITHVVVDEIHERDRFSDFMLAILRDLLASYPHLKLILMSATMDAERFSQYFTGCPIIRVPGFTYPVKSFYLEDVLSILRSAEANHLASTSLGDTEEHVQLDEEYHALLDESIDLVLANDEIDPLLKLVFAEAAPKVFNCQHSITGVSPLMVLAGKGRIGEVCMLLSFGANCSLKDQDGSTALDWAQRENQDEIFKIIKEHMDQSESSADQELLDKYLATVDPETIDTVLIERLLKKICLDSQEGAILVFLPGWDDINKTREKLRSSPFFRDSMKFVILALHSMIPSSEQKKVFRRPAASARKIILSTNIAETAVTIDDVVYVIDSGRMKEKSYDPYNNVSTLYSSWISKANAKQREGRAGRCQPGICYHLYSKARAESLPDYQVPEIKRMPIEELCLQVKLINPSYKIVEFLNKTLDPPVYETVHNAIVVLQDIGALTHDEKLTELGEKLGALPVHPSTSKMLFFATLMNCLDPALTLACTADYRDPFLLPMAPEERRKAAAAKVELAALYGGYSDHLTIIAAFDCWRRAKERGQETLFCTKYFVSSGTMHMLFGMRKQLQNELAKNGFIPKDASSCSLNAYDPGILRAVLMAGTYPMVGRLLPPFKNNKRAVVETASGAKASLHSHSSNFKLAFDKSVGGLLVMYDEITRGEGRLYIKKSSAIGPYPLLLLATEMVVAPPDENDDDSDEDEISGSDEDEMEMKASTSRKQGQEIMSSPENNVTVVVDRWLTFVSTAIEVAQIYCLRERLSAAILFKVQHPKQVLPPALGASVYAIACILSYDGMMGLTPPLQPMVSPLSAPVGRTSARDFGSGSGGFLRSLMSSDNPHQSYSGKSKVQAPNNNTGKFTPPKARLHQAPNTRNNGNFRPSYPKAPQPMEPNTARNFRPPHSEAPLPEEPNTSNTRNFRPPNPKVPLPQGTNPGTSTSRRKSFKRRRGSG